jgi:hypothetical protein
MSWLFICALHRLGLATNVKLPAGYSMPAWANRADPQSGPESLTS